MTPEAEARLHQVLGTLAVVACGIALCAFAFVKLSPVDLPWHLATGRLIVDHGVFPATNTYSWTHPDYPLYQQYPLFQAPLYWVQKTLGWEALSVMISVLWVGVGLTWLRLGGGWRHWVTQPLLAMGMILGIQRHIVPRPELFTMLFAGLLALALDTWRRSQKHGWLAAVVLLQWMMVNSHQLYVVGLCIQAGMLIHLVGHRWFGGKWGLEAVDAEVPLLPPALAFAGSIATMPISPLGLKIYLVPLATIETLLYKGNRGEVPAVSELQPVWTDPLAGTLAALFLLATLIHVAKGWGKLRLWELGMWAMGFAMVAAAQRGLPFFALTAGVMIARLSQRAPLFPPTAPLRAAVAIGAALIALWTPAQLTLAGAGYYLVEPGVGRASGTWTEDTMAAIAKDPPPGNLFNLTWVTGNALIWSGDDRLRPAIDPRFETYPADFLVDCQRAEHDAEVLQRLVGELDISWAVIELRTPGPRERAAELLQSEDWALTYADEHFVVVVRRRPETVDYIAAHEIALTDIAKPAPIGLPQIDAHAVGRVAHFLALMDDPRGAGWADEIRPVRGGGVAGLVDSIDAVASD